MQIKSVTIGFSIKNTSGTAVTSCGKALLTIEQTGEQPVISSWSRAKGQVMKGSHNIARLSFF